MRRLALAVLLVLVASPLAARDLPSVGSPLLDRLVGAWVLKGTIAGRETTHDVVAEWVLDHQYVRLVEVSREKDAAGKPLYEAIVLVGLGPGNRGFACLWLDSTGPYGLDPQAIGFAERADDRLAFVFKDKDGRFLTTFLWDAATGTWKWTMDAESADGKTVKPFARVTLTRKPG